MLFQAKIRRFWSLTAGPCLFESQQCVPQRLVMLCTVGECLEDTICTYNSQEHIHLN